MALADQAVEQTDGLGGPDAALEVGDQFPQAALGLGLVAVEGEGAAAADAGGVAAQVVPGQDGSVGEVGHVPFVDPSDSDPESRTCDT